MKLMRRKRWIILKKLSECVTLLFVKGNGVLHTWNNDNFLKFDYGLRSQFLRIFDCRFTLKTKFELSYDVVQYMLQHSNKISFLNTWPLNISQATMDSAYSNKFLKNFKQFFPLTYDSLLFKELIKATWNSA